MQASVFKDNGMDPPAGLQQYCKILARTDPTCDDIYDTDSESDIEEPRPEGGHHDAIPSDNRHSRYMATCDTLPLPATAIKPDAERSGAPDSGQAGSRSANPPCVSYPRDTAR